VFPDGLLEGSPDQLHLGLGLGQLHGDVGSIQARSHRPELAQPGGKHTWVQDRTQSGVQDGYTSRVEVVETWHFVQILLKYMYAQEYGNSVYIHIHFIFVSA